MKRAACCGMPALHFGRVKSWGRGVWAVLPPKREAALLLAARPQ